MIYKTILIILIAAISIYVTWKTFFVPKQLLQDNNYDEECKFLPREVYHKFNEFIINNNNDICQTLIVLLNMLNNGKGEIKNAHTLEKFRDYLDFEDLTSFEEWIESKL